MNLENAGSVFLYFLAGEWRFDRLVGVVEV